MKKLFFLLLSVLSLTAVAQNQKIALLEPRAGEGSTVISGMEKAMVRGELRKAIVNQHGYEAFTRADIDQLMKEQDFQRTGNVSEEDIHKMGKMAGADYICVSTLNKSNTEFYLEAYLINVESGAISNPASQYGELVNGKLGNMLPICQALAQELLGSNMSSVAPVERAATIDSKFDSSSEPMALPSTLPPTSAPTNVDVEGYVDLGLPSGTLWKTTNEENLLTLKQAIAKYGNQLPTHEQLEELTTLCTWTWVGNGYDVTGLNSNTVFIPSAQKKKTIYWCSTPFDMDAWLNQTKAQAQGGKMISFSFSVIPLEGSYYYCLMLKEKKKEVSVVAPQNMTKNMISAIRLVK